MMMVLGATQGVSISVYYLLPCDKQPNKSMREAEAPSPINRKYEDFRAIAMTLWLFSRSRSPD